MSHKNKFYVSIFTLWLFTISGIFGILSSHSEWFLGLTPLNLGLYFLLILWNLKKHSLKFFLACLIPFSFGFVSEFLGANYGLIFGSYNYGENLGYKIGGVPIMICVNWIVLTIITSDISCYFHRNIFVRSLLAAFMMVLLDIVIEVSAPRFDFWEFENGIVPIQNYVGWLFVSFLSHVGFQQFHFETHKKFSIHVFIAISIFFLTFLIV